MKNFCEHVWLWLRKLEEMNSVNIATCIITLKTYLLTTKSIKLPLELFKMCQIDSLTA